MFSNLRRGVDAKARAGIIEAEGLRGICLVLVFFSSCPSENLSLPHRLSPRRSESSSSAPRWREVKLDPLADATSVRISFRRDTSGSSKSPEQEAFL